MSEADKIDDYELVSCISSGSSTAIWEVKAGGNKSLVMKLLVPEAFQDPEQKRLLKHEHTVGKSLEHPCIIRIMDFKMTKKHGYFVMEHFRGTNLKSLIRTEHAEVQSKAKKLMESLSQALGYMHDKKWVHKDVKPDNVLLTKGGEVRLIDFSLASREGSAVARAFTKKKNIVIQGTRTYLAPELIRRERLTFSADMYSLGILLYEVLTGNPPFRTANPNDLLVLHVREKPPEPSLFDDNITPETDQLVLRMLAKYPKDRPSSMHELFAEVRNLKFFKEDPLELARKRREKQAHSAVQAEHDRLDSRMDAARTASGEVRPVPKPKPQPKIAPDLLKPAAKPSAAPPTPVATQQQPMMPGYGVPPMGFLGYPLPGMPMQPGMPMPPGYPPMGFPGYPMPGMPMQPGMPMPPEAFPGMPPVPMPTPPTGGQPGVPQPTHPAAGAVPMPTPPAPTPSKPREEPAEEIPLASIDELQIE